MIKIKQKIWTDLSPMKIYMANKQMQRCSTLLTKKDMQIKTSETPLHTH